MDSRQPCHEPLNGAIGQAIQGNATAVSDIISVIDGIARQANILALNAAVEAAGAGEQSRGFAAVAAEVRSLAQPSAEAAKEIKRPINRNVAQVEQGATLVDQAGKTMAEITDASIEQSSGISQVGDAVGQMGRVTPQSAARVEERAAAAESLKTQAQQLVRAVAGFRWWAG